MKRRKTLMRRSRSPKYRRLPAHRLIVGASSAERDPAFRAWIATFPCVVEGCENPSVCCHYRNKRMWGDVGNCFPACHLPHHDEQHRGIKTFQKKYGLDLAQIAAGYGEGWAHRIEAPEAVGVPMGSG